MKRIVLFFAFLLLGFGLKAQNDECMVNYSIYKEFVNVESYSNAVNTYRKIFQDCPKFNKIIYIDGVKIYKGLIAKTNDNNLINAYVDTIKLIYNQRIENYGEKPQCLSRMAFDVMKLRKSDTAYMEAFSLFDSSVKQFEGNADLGTLTAYFQLAVTLSTQKKLSNEKLFSVIVPQLLIIKQNNEKEKEEKLVAYLNKNLSKVSGYKETFDKLFVENYSVNSDIPFIVNLSSVMSDLDCIGNQLYAQCAEKLYNDNPSALSAVLIARYCKKNKEYDKAAEYYSKAVDLEEDANKKSLYLYESALVANYQKKYSLAISFAKKSLELNSKNANAYLLIGAVYGSNASLFGSDDFSHRQIYWVAADYVEKAKKTDISLKEQADELLKKYSALFPNKEDAFMHSVKSGDVVKITAFGTETTTARFL